MGLGYYTIKLKGYKKCRVESPLREVWWYNEGKREDRELVAKSSTLLASSAGPRIDCTLGGNLEKSFF